MSDARSRSRAGHLLPEEKAAGNEDPAALGEAVLAESDERQGDREAAPDAVVEHRSSEDTVAPTEP